MPSCSGAGNYFIIIIL